MQKVTIIGAAGKIGSRITKNLSESDRYQVAHIERSEAGRERLLQLGVTPGSPERDLPDADIVVLALPDRKIAASCAEILPLLKNGAMVVALDPATARAAVLPQRDGVSYFVVHPCHPPLFAAKDDDQSRDWFGGQGTVEQDIVCALYAGDERHYAEGERLAREMFAPVREAHRITVEQMAILEPAMVESLGATLLAAIKEALDRAIAMGVPRAAAESFLMGHLRTQLAVTFGFADFRFSDGAYLAMSRAHENIFKDGWLDICMSEESIVKSVREISGLSAM